jgi:hypothetical protein
MAQGSTYRGSERPFSHEASGSSCIDQLKGLDCTNRRRCWRCRQVEDAPIVDPCTSTNARTKRCTCWRARFGHDVASLVSRSGHGSFVFLPRGVPHEWDVVGVEAVVLIITAPARLEEFLHDFHDAHSNRGEIARRYGIDFQ